MLLSPALAIVVVAAAIATVAWRGAFLDGVVLLLVVLASLLAHELAHAVMARREGYAVDGVLMTLVGGTAAWSGDVEPDAHAAVVIAAAGPAMSAVLAVGGVGAASVVDAWWLDVLVAVNLLAATVNLVPVPGLDGHAIVRGLRR